MLCAFMFFRLMWKISVVSVLFVNFLIPQCWRSSTWSSWKRRWHSYVPSPLVTNNQECMLFICKKTQQNLSININITHSISCLWHTRKLCVNSVGNHHTIKNNGLTLNNVVFQFIKWSRVVVMTTQPPPHRAPPQSRPKHVFWALLFSLRRSWRTWKKIFRA